MDSTPVLYEERHGWNRSVALTVLSGGVFGIGGLIGYAELHLVRLLVIGSLATLGALYPSGVSGAVLECGTYGDAPQCVWADQSDFIFTNYDGSPGSMADLAAVTPTYVGAVEGRDSGL